MLLRRDNLVLIGVCVMWVILIRVYITAVSC